MDRPGFVVQEFVFEFAMISMLLKIAVSFGYYVVHGDMYVLDGRGVGVVGVLALHYLAPCAVVGM